MAVSSFRVKMSAALTSKTEVAQKTSASRNTQARKFDLLGELEMSCELKRLSVEIVHIFIK